MQSASSSTASLLSSSNKSSSKNWESSFAQLSSSYGFNGAVPSLPTKSSKSTKTTTSISTANPQSFTASPSVVRPTKDYESAFGQLSSNYGFGGGVPSLPPTKPKKSSKQSPPSPSPRHAAIHSGPSPKDYGAAFGSLSSSYGFGGPVSTLFTRN